MTVLRPLASASKWVDRHPYILAALVMGALVSVFFAPVVRRGATFSAVSNMQEYSYPWFDPATPPKAQLYPQLDQANFVHPRQVFLDRSLKVSGQIPLWDPMTFGGHPFFAGTGSRLAYPPLLLLTLMSSPSWTHDLYVALHLFGAGMATFALMRQFRVGTYGALLAGVAWAFSSYTLSWITLEMFAAPAALLPLALLCVRRWYDCGSIPALLAGALTLGLLFLGTSVEYALFCFLAVGAYVSCLALTRLVRRWAELTPARRLAVVAAPTLFLLGAAGVAAVGILPFLDLSAASERSPTARFTRALSVVPLRNFRYLLWPPPVVPDFFSATFLVISAQVFVGSVTAALAGLGLFLRRPGSSLARGLVVGLFLFTLGTPVTWMALRVVPPLEALNGFGRALFLFDLGLAVLAGLGLDAVVGALRRRSGRQPSEDRRRVWGAVPAALAAACLLVTAAQLIPYGRRVNPAFQPRADAQLYPSTPAIEAAQSLAGERPGRSAVAPVKRPGQLAVLVGAVGMAVDVPTVSGYDPVVPATVSRLWRVVNGEAVDSALSTPYPGTLLLSFESSSLRTDLLARMGVAAVMGPPDLNADPGWDVDSLSSRGLRQTYAGPDGTVLEVLDRRPRAAVALDAVWASSPSEALRRLTDPSFDAGRQVILEGRPLEPAGGGATNDGAGLQNVEWSIDSPNNLQLRVTSDRPGWLVLRDGWDPGWRAKVNGRGAEVLRADYNFRAVAVPAGTSTVDFAYRPTSVLVGAGISISSSALIVGMLVFPHVRRGARTQAVDPL